MKTVDIKELESAVPVTKLAMTRRERLQHWAHIVRNDARSNLRLYHGLEHQAKLWCHVVRMNQLVGSPIDLAAIDPIFREQGLAIDASLAQGMQFFELTQAQLHEFSCDCGGAISNTEMADRIERLAG